MLNRLTVSTLLKAVILSTAFIIVVMFSLSAWESWQRLQSANRISVIAGISANLFKAMHNLRTDMASTNRSMRADQPLEPELEKYLRALREAEMPAMNTGLTMLDNIEITQKS